MLDILDSEFIKFARVKGMRETIVIWKHGARNAVIPLMTFAGLTLAALMNGSIVVEQVFAWPGLGRMMIEGVDTAGHAVGTGDCTGVRILLRDDCAQSSTYCTDLPTPGSGIPTRVQAESL